MEGGAESWGSSPPGPPAPERRDWADLPKDALVAVGRAVPAGSRLWFRLVCRKWAAAGYVVEGVPYIRGEFWVCGRPVTRTRAADAAASVARAAMVMRILIEQDPCASSYYSSLSKFRGVICRYAAERGDLSMLKWAWTEGGGRLCEATPWVAARNGHLAVLQWAWAHGCERDKGTCYRAAENGHLEVLQWARAQGCPWDGHLCELAAKFGHLAVLQWARAQECPWNAMTCRGAASNRHLAVLQWARAQGCPWDAWTCARAAENGHFAVLQWLRAQGCPWDEWTCRSAAENGHLEVLQWARAQGCPWDTGTCEGAAAEGHLAVVEWARAQGCPENGDYVDRCLESAARKKKWEKAKVAHKNPFPLPPAKKIKGCY